MLRVTEKQNKEFERRNGIITPAFYKLFDLAGMVEMVAILNENTCYYLLQNFEGEYTLRLCSFKNLFEISKKQIRDENIITEEVFMEAYTQAHKSLTLKCELVNG